MYIFVYKWLLVYKEDNHKLSAFFIRVEMITYWNRPIAFGF